MAAPVPFQHQTAKMVKTSRDLPGGKVDLWLFQYSHSPYAAYTTRAEVVLYTDGVYEVSQSARLVGITRDQDTAFKLAERAQVGEYLPTVVTG